MKVNGVKFSIVTVMVDDCKYTESYLKSTIESIKNRNKSTFLTYKPIFVASTDVLYEVGDCIDGGEILYVDIICDGNRDREVSIAKGLSRCLKENNIKFLIYMKEEGK